MLKEELYCDDCRGILPTIPDESIDGVFTDPPFNVNLQPQRKTHGGINNDNLPPEEFDALIGGVFGHIYRVLKPNSVAWICCDWHCVSGFDRQLKTAGFDVKTWICWVKNNFGLGFHFRPQHEFIIAAFKGEPLVPKNAISNVWRVARLIKTLHPNEKPIELIQRALRQYNNAEDTILDPFAGSFSTCIAAKLLGMGYIGIDDDAKYLKIAKERLGETVVDLADKNNDILNKVKPNSINELL